MVSYKFTDDTNTVVHEISEDGKSYRSLSIVHPAYREWLAEGNTPDPADPPPPDPDPVDTPLTAEDTERLLIGQGVTRGQINQAKLDRGKPLP
jgi:hypothetical protein